MNYYARDNQLLSDHLEGASKLAGLFGSKFGFENAGAVVGLLHDHGKYTCAFQKYLKRSLNGESVRRGEVIHALQGARFVDEAIADPLISDILGNAIAMHHSGLFNCVFEGKRTLTVKADKPENILHYKEAVGNFSPSVDVDKIKAEVWRVSKICQENKLDAPFILHLLTKALFSCVVDADRCNSAGLYIEGELPDWKSMIRLFDRHISGFGAHGDLNQVRQAISLQCRDAGARKPGIYTLSIPTGGGKTLSSLRFALEHANANKLERIIYVIPYLSILDQTATELRKIFGKKADEYILEHHSNIELPEDEDEEDKYRLLSSRWDSPIVLTTMVQFLETIYSNKASKLRKFHNMANAVLVFDEVQSLPIKCTHLFNDAVNFLHQFGKSTVLLCTATQPHLHETERPIWLSKNSELVHVPEERSGVFKRVAIEDKSGTVKTYEEVVTLAKSQLKQGKSTLIILNTKRSAQEVYGQCAVPDCEKVFLTTDLCPAHRLGLIESLRKNLNPETRRLSLCVSTQLIEAGVDISFDCVIRAKAGLDSIVQAAGRCNRNGEQAELQSVFVVEPQEENLSRLLEIQEAKKITSRVLREKQGYDFLSDEVIAAFYKYYFFDQKQKMDFDTKDGVTTIYSLLSKNPLGAEAYRSRQGNPYKGLPAAFETAAKEFSVIDAAQTGVVVPYGEALQLISKFENTYETKVQMRILKKLQKYTVSVYSNVLEQLKEDRAVDVIRSVKDEFYLLSPDYYDPEQGLRREALYSLLDA